MHVSHPNCDLYCFQSASVFFMVTSITACMEEVSKHAAAAARKGKPKSAHFSKELSTWRAPCRAKPHPYKGSHLCSPSCGNMFVQLAPNPCGDSLPGNATFSFPADLCQLQVSYSQHALNRMIRSMLNLGVRSPCSSLISPFLSTTCFKTPIESHVSCHPFVAVPERTSVTPYPTRCAEL